MAITARVMTEALLHSATATWAAAGRRRRRHTPLRIRWHCAASLVASIAGLWPCNSLGQGIKVVADASGELTYTTDNRQFVRNFDWATVVRPGLAVSGSTGPVAMSGRLIGTFVRYARTTRENRNTFDADLNARFNVAAPTFYVDAGVRSVQFAQSPFDLAPDPVGGQDSITTTQYRISPVLELRLGPQTRLLARSDNTKTTENGSSASLSVSDAGGLFSKHLASVEHDGAQIDATLTAERQTTHYADAQTPRLTIDIARATVSVPLGPDVQVGARTGVERNNFESAQQSDNSRIVGVDASWQPSARTRLVGYRERRFFGSAWGLNFDHRLPMLAWRFGLTRDLSTAPQQLLEIGPTDNVRALLNTMLISRVPDAVSREDAVNDFMRRYNVPASVQAVTAVYSQRLSVVTSKSLQIVVGGRFSSLTTTLQRSDVEDAVDAGPFATNLARNNNVQRGASAAYGWRLGDGIGVGVEVDWRNARAKQGRGADNITERGMRFTLGRSLGSDTQVRAAASYREGQTGLARAFKEGAVLLGVDYRF